MDVSNLLSASQRRGYLQPPATNEPQHLYSMSHPTDPHNLKYTGMDHTMASAYPQQDANGVAPAAPQPLPINGQQAEPKNVSFELLLPQSPQHRARLPMRVQIYPHDTTDSIITTVKNFYGLYERKGVSFEDKNGNILIARYENFTKNMVVYVRVIPEDNEHDSYSPTPGESLSPRRPRLGEPFQMLPPSVNLNQPTSRPSSRTSRRRSKSPQSGRGRRSASASTNTKARVRPSAKRGPGSHASYADPYGDAASGYSDSDGGNASVTSSRRGKMEQVASAEISLDNIVEGGRRKRAKFDSSELPLFVPPQVPMTASISSVSPQRRISSHNGASPFSYTNQHTFSYTQPLASPQSYGQGEASYRQNMTTPYSNTSGPQGYRSRGYVGRNSGNGSLLLPTPDPTVGSVISDEDVALQLMRLGDASNFSTHGRTSTSTLDDALSGKADAASSEESDDGSDEEDPGLPALPYSNAHSASGRLHGEEIPHSDETSGEEYDDGNDESFRGDSDEIIPDEHQPSFKPRVNSVASVKSRAGSKSSKSGKPRMPVSKNKSKGAAAKAPISPTSLPSQSRKTSSASLNFQHQLGADEEDLSTKPRCQRCRKSKKGCDRQRPCQRCKDAGIGIEGCISEDEGNGRKGRYGRHMGVPVKKASTEFASGADMAVAAATSGYTLMAAPLVDKSKKRKR